MKTTKIFRKKFVQVFRNLKKAAAKNFSKLHHKCADLVNSETNIDIKMARGECDPCARPTRGRGSTPQTSNTIRGEADRLGGREGTTKSSTQAQAPSVQSESKGAQGSSTSTAGTLQPSLKSKEDISIPKQGTTGKPQQFLANYFKVNVDDSLVLHEYSVTFDPPLDSYMMKKALFYLNDNREKVFGPHLYDGGAMLYSVGSQVPADIVEYDVTDRRGPLRDFKIIIQPVQGTVNARKWSQVYSSLLKQSMYALKYIRIGRNFFDMGEAEFFHDKQIQIIPGIITSIRQHDAGLLLNVETTNKVIRMKTVLDLIEEKRAKEVTEELMKRKVEEEVLTTVVMTVYNTRTYNIARILWDSNPKETFPLGNGQETDYVTYYREHHQLNVTLNQPLLLVAPKKKDYHKVKENESPKNILVLPQFCQLVGLTPSMRGDFHLMKSIANKLLPPPQEKVNAIRKFREKLDNVPQVTALWKSWNIKIGTDLITIPGRVYPHTQEKIMFANNKSVNPAPGKGEWNNAFRKECLFLAAQLSSWSIIYPSRNEEDVRNTVNMLKQVGQNIGFNIVDPVYKSIHGVRTTNYLDAIDAVVKLQENGLIFVVLASDSSETYGAIKKKLTVDLGIPSQCFLSRKLKGNGLMSIVTKVAVQINSKLGGESWATQIPLQNTIVVGQVLERCKTSKGYISAMVATITGSSAKFFSTVSRIDSVDQLTQHLPDDLGRCFKAYRLQNGNFPKRVFLFMEGYSEGDIGGFIHFHIPQLRLSLIDFYASYEEGAPQLTVMLVNRNPGMRIFQNSENSITNPIPGTIVDDKITLPHLNDFYLIPQSIRQGTVTPTSFIILYDEQAIGSDKLQRLAYKFCNAYFNCFCTIAIPAPCQYARRLAMQMVAINSTTFSSKLSYSLFYL